MRTPRGLWVAALFVTLLGASASGEAAAAPFGNMTLTGGNLAAADEQVSGSVNDLAGTSVAEAGDVNGDGYGDFLVGAPGNDSGPGNDGGAAFLLRGSPGGWGTHINSHPQLVVYRGGNGEAAGTSVAGAGDVNNDGFDDIVVGAPGEDTGGADAGAAYIVLGSATPTSSDLSTHIRLTGQAAGDAAGKSVAGGADFNGDGFDDVVVGAPLEGGTDAGAAYLALGSNTPAPGSLGGHFKYSGETTIAGDMAGTSVAMGDTDGDGFGDLLIGAPFNDDSGGANSGAAYLIVGSNPPVSASLGVGTPTVVQLQGIAGENAGQSVALGDVNGDGRDDFIVGAPGSVTDTGGVYLAPGRPGLPNNSLSLIGTFLGGEATGDRAGASVAFVGDVDADGDGEFVVGALNATSVDKGAAYLVRGSALPAAGALASQVRYEGQLNNDKAGNAVGGASDLNGDALADVLVGAAENDQPFSNGGVGYVLLGPTATADSPGYTHRKWFEAATSGNTLPARFKQARVTVDFTAGALDHGTIDVTRHLFDPCETDMRAARPIWEIDSTKISSGITNVNVRFKYTDAELAGDEESKLFIWKRASGDPCGDWTQVPLADTTRDATHNRVSVQINGATSLGQFTIAEAQVAPAVEITSGGGPTTDATPTFTFAATPTNVDVECRIDTAAFGACSSATTHTPAGQAQGAHTFEVRATNALGSATDTVSFSVDNVGPTVTISSGPTAASTSSDRNPSFAFDASESGVEFECQLDGAGFNPCTSPQALNNLSNATHTFIVRGTDATGNISVSVSRTWTVDATAPTLDITAGPANGSFTNDNTPTHNFSSNEGTVNCRYDAVAFAACSGGSSSHTPSALTNGEHTFQVRSIDVAGNLTLRERTFTVDTTAPTLTMSGPPGTNPSSEATLNFAGNEPVTFECKLDAASFAPCTSPVALSGLGNGPHVFEVRATDRAGNQSAGNFGWTVTSPPSPDVQPPNLEITSGPLNGAHTNDNTPTYGFETNEGTLTCRFDASAFAACSGGTTHTPGALSDGPHTFSVRAVDGSGNTSTRSRDAIVDTAGPSAQFTVAPLEASVSPDRDPVVGFKSSEDGSTFECQLDSGSFAGCTSPFGAPQLGDGGHSVSVRATDLAGNVGPPATRSFVVDSVGPLAVITAGPSFGGRTNDPTPSFTFSSEPGATFQCRFAGGAFGACSAADSHTAPAALPDGVHAFFVRAIDVAGNAGDELDRIFTLDTVLPVLKVSGPARVKARTRTVRVPFKLAASETSTFTCKVDKAAAARCTRSFKTKALRAGRHTLVVTATDLAGNVATKTKRFRILPR